MTITPITIQLDDMTIDSWWDSRCAQPRRKSTRAAARRDVGSAWSGARPDKFKWVSRTRRGAYRRVFTKNRENNPMQSRTLRLAALVQRRVRAEKWSVVAPPT